MSASDPTVREKLDAFQQQFRSSAEHTPTLFDVIGRPTEEKYWQRLLAYFLRPAKSHGFGSDILEVFLNTVEAETKISDLNGTLDTVRVSIEVPTSSNKQVDLFLYQENKWFLCIELKVQASEHDEQTVAYVDTDHIGTIAKSDFQPKYHNYLYVATNRSDEPTSEQFEYLHWSTLEKRFQATLENHRNDDGTYPTRGVAQFAEFLTMVRTEVGDSFTNMESYYRNIPTAKNAYEELAKSLATALENEVRDRTEDGDSLRIRRKRRGFPQFNHKKYNRLEIDKPLWQAGRNKPTVLYEFNFHLRPHFGPGETKQRPSVAVNLDIRGGSELKWTLREEFEARVDAGKYCQHGFGYPHTNPKWHFLSKEVLLDETKTPVSDLVESFVFLHTFESVLDEITDAV